MVLASNESGVASRFFLNPRFRKRTDYAANGEYHVHEHMVAEEHSAQDVSFNFQFGAGPSVEDHASKETGWEADQPEFLLCHSDRQPVKQARMGPERHRYECRSRVSDKAGDSYTTFSRFLSRVKVHRKHASLQYHLTKRNTSSGITGYGLASQSDNTESVVSPSSLQANGAMASQSTMDLGKAVLISNPYETAPLAQHMCADVDARRTNNDCVANKTKGKGKMPVIPDLQWENFESAELLQAILASYSTELPVERPTGNRTGSLDKDNTLVDRDISTASNAALSIEKTGNCDKTPAANICLEEEMAAKHQAKSDKALEGLKRVELKRQHRSGEGGQRAEALAKEAEVNRYGQGEEDRIRKEALQAKEARIAAELVRKRECICCGDIKQPLDFPARPATSICSHNSLTCTDCMERWLASELDQKGCTDLKCPECPQSLSYDDVYRGASKKTFAAYEKLLMRSALASIDEFAWCLNPICESGQINTDNDNFMDCVSCGYKQCLRHARPWHTGETCKQYEYRTSGQKARDEEAATERMLDSMSKKCPGKNCGWRIQKSDGCDHMTCKKCKFEFCWECLSSHRTIKKVGNTAHANWCKFHSDNLETSWPFNVHA